MLPLLTSKRALGLIESSETSPGLPTTRVPRGARRDRAGLEGILPTLVSDENLRGILLYHTDASDGMETSDAMAKATRGAGSSIWPRSRVPALTIANSSTFKRAAKFWGRRSVIASNIRKRPDALFTLELVDVDLVDREWLAMVELRDPLLEIAAEFRDRNKSRSQLHVNEV